MKIKNRSGKKLGKGGKKFKNNYAGNRETVKGMGR